MSRSDNRWMLTAAQVWSIPMLVLIATGIGLGLGLWLDSKLGTKPWLAIVLCLVGLAAGLYESAKILVSLTRENDDNG
jgi:F0F1-type ATP synthase assembly protein I